MPQVAPLVFATTAGSLDRMPATDEQEQAPLYGKGCGRGGVDERAAVPGTGRGRGGGVNCGVGVSVSAAGLPYGVAHQFGGAACMPGASTRIL